MRRNRCLLGGSVVLALAAVTCSLLTTGFLDKTGRLGSGRMNFAYAPVANCAAGLLLAAPLVAHLALCTWWRHDRCESAVGLLTVAVSCGVTVWGSVTDYLS